MSGSPQRERRRIEVNDAGHARSEAGRPELDDGTKVETRNLCVYYGNFRAIRDINLKFPTGKISALIGSSGSGKSTLLRAINRMHDVTPGISVTGNVDLDRDPIYGENVDPIVVRRRVGMVFQRPNPFEKSIFENVSYGLKFLGRLPKSEQQDRVQGALKRAGLWNEVHDRLSSSAFSLSGGQQQRLCIARAIAVEPEVILMDEPTSALDPIATHNVEELMRELSRKFTIIVVTHNMQQAARVSHFTAYMTMDDDRAGVVVEVGPTGQIFTNPEDPRTEDYITGRIG